MAAQTSSPGLSAESMSLSAGSGLRRLPAIAGAIGVLGVAVSVGMASLGDDAARQQFYFSWLVAFSFVFSLSIGSLYFVLIQYASRAGWSVVVRRMAENVMGVLPLCVLLFLPVLLGMHDLYHWTHEKALAHDPVLQSKQPYLNQTFFVIRAVIYFVVWCGIAVWYRRKSIEQDQSGDHDITRSLQYWSGPAILVLAITQTLASIDWLMSLEPHWFSTIYGVYFFSGAFVGFFALLTLLAVLLRRVGPLRDTVTVEHLHDIGKLIFAFMVFWSYIAFSQFMLIWYGNIPEETIYFLDRWESSWRTVSIMLAAGHFVIPFFFMLPRQVKRSPLLLAISSLWILAVHLLDMYWLVMPTLHSHGVHVSLMDLTTFLGVTGLFVAGVMRLTIDRPLVPVRDPRLPESLGFENI